MNEEEKINVKNLMGIGGVILSFVLLFFDWFMVKTSYAGDNGYSNYFGLFANKVDNLSILFDVVKVCAIINILAFAIYMLVTVGKKFIDLKKLIPQIKDVNVEKISKMTFFGTYALALVIGLIACLTSSKVVLSAKLSYSPTFAWILALIIFVITSLITFKPEKIDELTNKIKTVSNENSNLDNNVKIS